VGVPFLAGLCALECYSKSIEICKTNKIIKKYAKLFKKWEKFFFGKSIEIYKINKKCKKV